MNIKVAASGAGNVRRNLAVQNLMGAACMSRKVGEIEIANAGQPFGSFFDEITGYSNACILLSAAALEAYANEMYLSPNASFPELTSEHIAQVWPIIERGDILSKFQIALTLRSIQPMNKGLPPFQNAALLVALRNAITHFKPEWANENAEHKKLSAKLEAALGNGSSYFEGEPLFPVRWMTHENTSWAVRSSLNFMKAFEVAARYKAKIDYSTIIF